MSIRDFFPSQSSPESGATHDSDTNSDEMIVESNPSKKHCSGETEKEEGLLSRQYLAPKYSN